VLGTVEHQKAEKSLDSLMALSSPVAKVIREGKKQEILSREIVPGDILLLEAGDMVAADGRILENYSLLVNESSLTGESINVEKRTGRIREKKVPLAEQTNMVFSGSLVAAGRAKVLITGTGMDTEIGRIASLMNDTGEKKRPLQVTLDQFGSMHCHHRSGNGHTENGRRECHHKGFKGSGKPWLCFGHLLR